MSSPHELFLKECDENAKKMASSQCLRRATLEWLTETGKLRYSYNFTWLSRPIIQYPQDMVAMQELIWKTRPDLIVETGIAHGGSLVMSASMLALLDYCDAVEAGHKIEPKASGRRVLGVDIDIRAHNRTAIEAHPLSHLIHMIQGSSIAPEIISRVHDFAYNYGRILVFLDANHTHEHVLAELEAYAPIVSIGSYCVVFDTVIEDLPEDMFPDRPWGRGDSPKTAVERYLSILMNEGRKGREGSTLRFEHDTALEDKLLITVAPGGYLRRIE